MLLRRLSLMVVAAAVCVSVAHADDRLSDEARGDQLYVRHCLGCHGAELDGQGVVASALIASVPDLRTQMTDANMDEHVDVVLSGKASMPSFSLSFDRYDARRVWRHMQRIATGDLPDPEPDTDTDSEGATP